MAKLKQFALADAEKPEKGAPVPAIVDAARGALLDAQRELAASQTLAAGLKEERDSIPSRLWKWSQLPCGAVLVDWALCSSVDKVPEGTEPKTDLAKVAAAQTTAKWMNEIVLPLLLGWVGAYAFVIRGMTAEISQRSFTKSSTLRHIARLSLGALAGIASGWLFTPEVVSAQLKNVPAWVLAFVAGYGIELVFAFLDRVIGAFSTKTT